MNKRIGFAGVLGVGVVGLLAANVLIMSNLLSTEKDPAALTGSAAAANYQSGGAAADNRSDAAVADNRGDAAGADYQSIAAATDDQSQSAVTNYQNDTADASVGLYQSSGGFTYLAAQNTGGGEVTSLEEAKNHMLSRPEVLPEKSNLSKDEVLQLFTDNLTGKFGLKKEDLAKFDYSLTSVKATDFSAQEKEILLWDILYYPKNQSDFPKIYRIGGHINDETKEIKVFINYNDQEGTPLEHEIHEPQVSKLAVSAIQQKYALTDATLNRFTITCTYYIDNPSVKSDTHLWRIYFYPANRDEYSEIGCYTAYLDAVSGEVIRLESAGDGNG